MFLRIRIRDWIYKNEAMVSRVQRREYNAYSENNHVPQSICEKALCKLLQYSLHLSHRRENFLGKWAQVNALIRKYIGWSIRRKKEKYRWQFLIHSNRINGWNHKNKQINGWDFKHCTLSILSLPILPKLFMNDPHLFWLRIQMKRENPVLIWSHYCNLMYIIFSKMIYINTTNLFLFFI